MNAYFDTHAHLQDTEFADDLGAVIQRAGQAGVEHIALIGEDMENSRQAIVLAATSDLFVAAAGVHPHKASEWEEQSLDLLRNLLTTNKNVVAVGEIGLDYHYDFSPRKKQRQAFYAQLQIAREEGYPVVLHCREAYEDMLAIAQEWLGTRLPATPPIGIMHCYLGSVQYAHQFMDMGFMLGIGGAATFKKAEELHAVVREAPIEKLILETDAPYMTPVPHRGTRNEPAYLPLVAARIAELKQMDVSDVVRITTDNACRVFRLTPDNKG